MSVAKKNNTLLDINLERLYPSNVKLLSIPFRSKKDVSIVVDLNIP